MAWVNDQPRGQTNIEAPLSTIKEALFEAIQEAGAFGGNNGPTTVILEVDRRELGRVVVPAYDGEKLRMGVRIQPRGALV